MQSHLPPAPQQAKTTDLCDFGPRLYRHDSRHRRSFPSGNVFQEMFESQMRFLFRAEGQHTWSDVVPNLVPSLGMTKKEQILDSKTLIARKEPRGSGTRIALGMPIWMALPLRIKDFIHRSFHIGKQVALHFVAR